MYRPEVIDRFLEQVLRPDARQKNRVQARERLVPLLEHFGYHHTSPCAYESYITSNGEWCYMRERFVLLCADCATVKPYHLYTIQGGLEIHHGHLCTGHGRAHEEAFLREMVPVISRLDAAAHFIPGEKGNGPWLRIYL